MFSKLLSSARQIFTKPEDDSTTPNTLHQVLDSTGRSSPAKRSPKKNASPRKQQVKSAYSVQKEKRDNAVMVTTRRQSGALLLGSQSNSAATSENEINEDEIAYELLTQSAQKRRREKAREAGEETPSKRRKLPVRGKDESPAVIVHSRLAVEIPVKDIDSEGDATLQAISDVAAKLAAAESPAITPSQKKRGRPAKNAVLEDASEQLKKDVAAFEAQKASKPVEEKVAKPQAAKSTPKSNKKGKKSPPAEPEKVATPPIASPKKETPAKPKHKKFGDDEPVAPIPLPEPLVEALEKESGSEDESSDDDAPEEVGGKAAQETAQASVAQAAKAAEAKQAAEDKKRKEKEEKLKAQAQASKKRKMEEEKAAVEAMRESDSEEDVDEDESMTLQEESSPTLEVRAETTRETKKIKFDRNNLPDLLPEDFLEDEDAMDVDSEEDERPKKARKIKFAQEEKRIKDVTLGHTTFRVQKKSKSGLAPKANKRAKMLKEALLGKRKGQIRKAPTGFFGAKK